MSSRRTNITLLLLVSLTIVLLSEITSILILKSQPLNSHRPILGDRWKFSNVYNVLPDNSLGWRLPSDSQIRASIYTPNNSLVYDVVYTTDSRGRRITTKQSLADKPEFLLLFGDSTVFSTGLSDSDSLQDNLQTLLPKKALYNYAVFGYGPHQMLELLRKKDFSSEVFQSKGSAIFVILDTHLGRIRGSVDNTWSKGTPCFKLVGKKLENQGSLETCMPLKMKLYSLMKNIKKASNTIKLLNPEYPNQASKEDEALLTAILEESAKLLETKTGAKLSLIFHPLYSNPQSSFNKSLRRALERKNISFIDINFSPEPGKTLSSYMIPFEGHPNGAFNKIFASKIANSLPQLSSNANLN